MLRRYVKRLLVPAPLILGECLFRGAGYLENLKSRR
jgi:hypothetical protein